MRAYEVDGYKITAVSSAMAVKLADRLTPESLGDGKRSVHILYESGDVVSLQLRDERCTVFVRDGDSIIQSGTLIPEVGLGSDIVATAINSIDKSAEQSRAIAAEKRRIKRLQAIESYQETVEQFIATVPETCHGRIKALIKQLNDGQVQLTTRMIAEIKADGGVKPANWESILKWFYDNVIDKDSTGDYMRMRKAFISTCKRMGQADIRTVNTVEENADDFWLKFASEKQRGDGGDRRQDPGSLGS